MRLPFEPQKKLNQIHFTDIEIDLSSRDEIPKILIGLKHIYENKAIRDQIFEILYDAVPENVSTKKGRRGMDLWTILVLGTIRLNCNWDYDKVQEIANNHITLRKMLGHGFKIVGNISDDGYRYALQTIKDNVSLLTPEVLDRINELVVKEGHNLLNKKNNSDRKNEKGSMKLKGKCDSYVVETDVHFPTDINLLFDAVRVMIRLIAGLCSSLGIDEWRQHVYCIGKIKRYYRVIMMLKRSTSKDEDKKAERDQKIEDAYTDYLELVISYVKKCILTIETIKKMGTDCLIDELIKNIEEKIEKANIFLDQIKRRAIEGETIPHGEKIFSIFEEHTEWIKKGKAGVLVELGVRVSILEDQHGFILTHIVMEKQTDDKVAVEIVKKGKKIFPELASCSFDKGYYTPKNRKELGEILENVIMPKKGKLSKSDQLIENSEEFIRERKKHSRVEPAINALENHGLDKCPDHGTKGFKRYISLGVLARNIQKLGHIIQQNQKKKEKRKEKVQETWKQKKAA